MNPFDPIDATKSARLVSSTPSISQGRKRIFPIKDSICISVLQMPSTTATNELWGELDGLNGVTLREVAFDPADIEALVSEIASNTDDVLVIVCDTNEINLLAGFNSPSFLSALNEFQGYRILCLEQDWSIPLIDRQCEYRVDSLARAGMRIRELFEVHARYAQDPTLMACIRHLESDIHEFKQVSSKLGEYIVALNQHVLSQTQHISTLDQLVKPLDRQVDALQKSKRYLQIGISALLLLSVAVGFWMNANST